MSSNIAKPLLIDICQKIFVNTIAFKLLSELERDIPNHIDQLSTNNTLPKVQAIHKPPRQSSRAHTFKVTYCGTPMTDLLVRKQMLVFQSRVMEQGSLSRTCIIGVQQH